MNTSGLPSGCTANVSRSVRCRSGTPPKAQNAFPLPDSRVGGGTAELQEADTLGGERSAQEQRADDVDEQSEGIQGHQRSSSWIVVGYSVTLYSIHSVS